MEASELCRECRAPVQVGARFCAACGQAIGSSSPESERRHLTLLFCDVAESTALSERLDPEDLRDLLTSYQRACQDAIRRYQGHVSQFLGDGVMSYFGYPVAHEDDAVLATRAALRIVEDIKVVNQGIGKRLHAEIHVRLGLHSGVAVVGEVGRGRDRLAVGETVNLAARIQSFAQVDTVLVSASTARLIDGYFELESLQAHTLKGFTRPVELFRVVRFTGARTKFEATARGSLTPLIGREKELEELASAWKDVREGADRVVVVRGEAGIGKSRIVHDFRNATLAEGAVVLECFCSPLTQVTAFAPVIEMLDAQVAHRARGQTNPQAKLEALASLLGEHSRFGADALPLVAALISIEGADETAIRDLSPVRRRARSLEILREWMGWSAERLPLALLIEDIHWADPSTLDFLDLVIQKHPGGRTLLCVTSRPEFLVPWPRAQVRTIELTRLNASEVEAIVTHVAGGHALPPLVARRIAERSEGVPLFVEEVTKTVLESGALRFVDANRYELEGPLDERYLPSTIEGSLVARFDRLGESRGVAQLGAAIGREFAYPLIRAVSGMSDEELRPKLDHLGRSELVFVHGAPPNAIYTFKHALIQDALYGTLLKSERVRVHDRIYNALREKLPEVLGARPEMGAYHAEKGGQPEVAISLLRDAGRSALRRTAVAEAVKHLAHGIDLVDVLEEPARALMEIELQAAIGPAYMATVGWAAPEVEQSSARLRDLSAAKGDGPRLFQAMWSLWTVDFLRGRLGPALDVASQVLAMAQAAGDPLIRTAGHHAVGYTHFYRGEYEQALHHADEGLALFDLETEKRIASMFQFSSSSAMRCFRTEALQVLGRPDAAADSLREWRELLDDLGHAPSRAYALTQQCFFFHVQGDFEKVHELATEARAVSLAEGFALWVPITETFLAWAGARQGRNANEAVETIQIAKAQIDQSLTRITEVELTTMLAETLLLANRPQEIFQVVKPVLEVTQRGMLGHYVPELFRLQGEAAKTMGDRKRAVGFYRTAIEAASHMGAKELERRAVIALERRGTVETTVGEIDAS